VKCFILGERMHTGEIESERERERESWAQRYKIIDFVV